MEQGSENRPTWALTSQFQFCLSLLEDLKHLAVLSGHGLHVPKDKVTVRHTDADEVPHTDSRTLFPSTLPFPTPSSSGPMFLVLFFFSP